ncbi:MAG: transposase [Pseudonocardiaceae bacterium]
MAFSVELTDPHRSSAPVIGWGVDLGIKSLAVLSTGRVVPNPRRLDDALRALRRIQRQASRRRGPDRRTRTVASNRWRQTTARLSALHTRVGAARRDGLHQLTTGWGWRSCVASSTTRPARLVRAWWSRIGGFPPVRPARRVVR